MCSSDLAAMRIVHMIHYLAKQPLIIVAYIVKPINLIPDTHYRHIYRLKLSNLGRGRESFNISEVEVMANDFNVPINFEALVFL